MFVLIDWLMAFSLEYLSVLNSGQTVTYGGVTSTFFATFLVVSLFSYRAFEEEHLASYSEQATRTVVSLLVSIVLTALVFSLVRSKLAFRPTLLTASLLVLIIPLVNTRLYITILKRRRPKEYVLVMRSEHYEKLRPILEEVQNRANGYFKLKGVYDITGGTEVLDEVLSNTERPPTFFVGSAQEHEILREYLYRRQIPCEVFHIVDLIEKTLKRVPLELISLYRLYYEIQLYRVENSPVKRVFDFVLALLGTIITAPFLALAILLVFLEDGRPVLFKQRRVGLRGKIFTFIKVRTLKELTSAGDRTFVLDSQHREPDIESRMLRTGKFLRHTRLDELPQFWLVLKGDMSIVGPRPEMVEYHERYSKLIPFYNYRLNVKPGLTGWAQINYKHTSTLEEYIRKTEYDLYYIKNKSFLLDLQIILQTLEAIFWRRGAR